MIKLFFFSYGDIDIYMLVMHFLVFYMRVLLEHFLDEHGSILTPIYKPMAKWVLIFAFFVSSCGIIVCKLSVLKGHPGACLGAQAK